MLFKKDSVMNDMLVQLPWRLCRLRCLRRGFRIDFPNFQNARGRISTSASGLLIQNVEDLGGKQQVGNQSRNFDCLICESVGF